MYCIVAPDPDLLRKQKYSNPHLPSKSSMMYEMVVEMRLDGYYQDGLVARSIVGMWLSRWLG